MAKKHEIVIQNVVVSADTHMKFPLEILAQKLENAEYEPESFPGLVYRVHKPKASTLLFTTGKVICSGGKSLNEARRAIKRALEKIGEAGITPSKRVDVEVVNIVASASLGAKLDLNKIVFDLGECEYEPEQFPGLVYRLDSPKVVFLIFNSGKLVCTGAKYEDDVDKAVNKLEKQLKAVGAIKKS